MISSLAALSDSVSWDILEVLVADVLACSLDVSEADALAVETGPAELGVPESTVVISLVLVATFKAFAGEPDHLQGFASGVGQAGQPVFV